MKILGIFPVWIWAVLVVAGFVFGVGHLVEVSYLNV